MPVLYCIVYYVYANPAYEVANKLICILYLFLGRTTGEKLKVSDGAHIYTFTRRQQ